MTDEAPLIERLTKIRERLGMWADKETIDEALARLSELEQLTDADFDAQVDLHAKVSELEQQLRLEEHVRKLNELSLQGRVSAYEQARETIRQEAREDFRRGQTARSSALERAGAIIDKALAAAAPAEAPRTPEQQEADFQRVRAEAHERWAEEDAAAPRETEPRCSRKHLVITRTAVSPDHPGYTRTVVCLDPDCPAHGKTSEQEHSWYTEEPGRRKGSENA